MRKLRMIHLLLVLALVAPAAARADDPVAGGPTINLSDAVARTLRLQPEIQKAASDVALRRGQLTEASGLFDSVFTASSQAQLGREALTGQPWRDERDRRIKLVLSADYIYRAADEVEAGTGARAGQAVNQCPDYITETFLVIDKTTTQQNLPFPTIVCLDRFGNVVGIVNPIAIQGRDQALQIAQTLYTKALELYEQFAKIGEIPGTQLNYRFDLGLKHQTNFRNGSQLSLNFSLRGTELDFVGKPARFDCGPFFFFDPNVQGDPPRDFNSSDCGDSPQINSFTSRIGFTYLVPLGKKRGRASAQASELAAQANLKAAWLALAHTAAERSLETINAYWDAAAARDRLRYLQGSSQIQQRLVGATHDLISGGEKAESELSKAQARAAQVDAGVAAAREELVKARVALVAAMGTSASSLAEAPLPAEALDSVAAANALDPAPWIRDGMTSRYDIQAAAEEVHAAQILERAAKVDLGGRVDLTMGMYYSGLYESWDKPFYRGDALWQATQGGLAGPSWTVALKFTLPVGNNAARGRLKQATSSLTKNQIQEGDLKRQMRIAVVDVATELGQAIEAKAQLVEAAKQYEATLGSSLERFKAGDLSLTDTLLTEEKLTQAHLSVIDVARDIAKLTARLRFESGRLLEGGFEGHEFDPARARLAALAP